MVNNMQDHLLPHHGANASCQLIRSICNKNLQKRRFGCLRHTKTASFTELNEMLYHTSRNMRVQRLNLDNWIACMHVPKAYKEYLKRANLANVFFKPACRQSLE